MARVGGKYGCCFFNMALYTQIVTEEYLEKILTNEREWRKFILEEMEKLSNKLISNILVNTVEIEKLKTKVAIYSSFFGIIGGMITAIISVSISKFIL